MAEAAARTLLLACVGLSLEIVFTALCDLRKAGDFKLKGHTYVWMIPIYSLIYPILCRLYPLLQDVSWPLRGIVYMALIFAVEYSSGWLLRKTTGACPWEDGYRQARWGVHGLIRLDFAPGWFAASLLFERVFLLLKGQA